MQNFPIEFGIYQRFKVNYAHFSIQDGKKLLEGFLDGNEPMQLANMSLYDEVGEFKSRNAIIAYSRQGLRRHFQFVGS